MAGIYDRFASLADRLVTQFDMGGTATLVQIVTPDPDPLKPPTVTDGGFSIPAVVFGVTGDMVARDPDLVATDLRVIIAAAHWVPLVPGDVLRIDGKDRAVVRVEPVPAAGVVSIYKLIVR